MLLPLLALAATALAVPLRENDSSDKCALSCSDWGNEYRYESGKTYEYELDTETKVKVGADEQTIRTRAHAAVAVVAPCELALTLREVESDGEEASGWAEALERNPLRFAFSEGLVHHICPAQDDPIWVLNIKRGILSTFQHSMQNEYTEDVSGKCLTEFEQISADEWGRVRRPDHCTGAHHSHSAFKHTPFNSNTGVRRAPLVESEQKCRHRLSGGVIQWAECRETHSSALSASSPQSSITAHILQTLKLLDTKPISESDYYSAKSRQSLLFDHGELEEERESVYLPVQPIIDQLCQLQVDDDVRPEAPGLFTELVHRLRGASQAQLNAALAQAQRASTCKGERRLLLDAVASCHSPACLRAVVKLIEEKKLTQSEKNTWIASLAFVTKPTLEIIEILKPIVEKEKEQGLLSISALVHTYCQQNENCAEQTSVASINLMLLNILQNDCSSATKQRRHEVLLALKALGNIGHSRTALATLRRCAMKEGNSVAVRSAAVQAMRRMPCPELETEEALRTLFGDSQQPVELRLHAFLQIVNCPCKQNVAFIIETIEQEPVNQVGTFVWSYLETRKRRRDPCSARLRELLEQTRLDRTRFDRDPSQFSRFEQYGRWGPLGATGAHVDKAVIYSPESYLPRELMLNLTVDLFGSSVNLLEVGGRAEGVDRLMDDLFGPEGYFSYPNAYFFGKKAGKKEHENPKVTRLQRLFNEREGSRADSSSVSLSAYVRVFGDELAFWGVEDVNMIDKVKTLTDIEQMVLALGQERKLKLVKSLLLADSTKTFPTVSGMPLRLSVNVSAAVNLQASGKMDMTKLMRTGDVHIYTDVKPSAAVEVAAALRVQMGGARSAGGRLLLRLHSSTHGKHSLQLKEGQQFDFSLAFPDSQMEIVDIQTQMFSLKNSKMEEFIDPSYENEQRSEACSSQMFNKITGVKLCSLYKNNENGLLKLKVTMEKDDPTLTEYIFRQKWHTFTVEKDGKNGLTYFVELDTPGSSVDRHLKALIDYRPVDGVVDLQLLSPFRQLQATGKIMETSNENEKEAEIELMVDKSRKYKLGATITRDLREDGARFDLTARGSGPETSQPITLRTLLDYQTYRYFTLDAQLLNIYQTPLKLNAKYTIPDESEMKGEMALSVQTPVVEGEGKAMGSVDQNGALAALLDFSYSPPSKRSASNKQLTIKLDQQINPFGNTGYKKMTEMSFSCSALPKYKWNLVHNMERDDQTISNEVTVVYGETDERAYLLQRSRFRSPSAFTAELQAVLAPYDIDHKASVEWENSLPAQLVAVAKAEMPDSEPITAQLRLANDQSDQWKLDAQAELTAPGRHIRAHKTIEQVGRDEYKMTTLLEWSKDEQLKINSDLKIQTDSDTFEYDIRSLATLSGQPHRIHIHKRYRYTPEESNYLAKAKMADETLYNLQVDITNDDYNERTINAALSSKYLETKYGLEGSVKSEGASTELTGTLKRDGQDTGKALFLLPQSFSLKTLRTNAQVKGEVKWELESGRPQELLAELKGSEGLYELTLREHSEQRRNQLYLAANTASEPALSLLAQLSQQDTIVMDVSSELSFDPYITDSNAKTGVSFALKTNQPWTPRHYTGTLHMRSKMAEGVETLTRKAELRCQLSNKNIVHLESKTELKPTKSGSGYRQHNGLKAELMDKKLHFEVVRDPNHLQKGKVLVGWESAGREEQLESRVSLSRTPQGWTFDHHTTTPYDQMKSLKVNIAKQKLESARNYQIKVNTQLELNGQKLEGTVKGEASDQLLDVDVDLASNVQRLNSLKLKLKSTEDRQFLLQTIINGGTEYKIYREANEPESKKVGFVAKMSDYFDYEGYYKDGYSTDMSEVEIYYKGENRETERGNGEWKLEALEDKRKETISLNLKTPFDKFSSANIQVVHVGEGKYEIDTEKNGESQVKLEGEMRSLNQERYIKIQVTNIDTPLKLLYKNSQIGAKSEVKMEYMSGVREQEKKYGFHYEQNEESADRTSATVRVLHPARQLTASAAVTRAPTKTQLEINIMPDSEEKREPSTLVILKEVKRSSDDHLVTEIRATLRDPHLVQPVHLTGKYAVSGCADAEEGCRRSVRLLLDYSSDSTKQLILQASIANPHITLNRVSRSVKISAKHLASKLDSQLWMGSMSERVEEGVYKRGLDAGVQYMDGSGEMREYKAHSLVDPQAGLVSLNANLPSHQYKLEVQAPQANKLLVRFYQNDPAIPAITCTVLADPRENTLQLEAVQPDTNTVLLHASAKMLNKDAMKVKVWHTEQGRKVKDGDIHLRLDRSDLLTFKYFLRPEIAQQIQSMDVSGYLPEGGRVSGERVRQTMSETTGRISEDIMDTLSPLRRGWATERGQMARELGPIWDQLTGEVAALADAALQALLSLLDVIQDSLAEIIPDYQSQYYSQALSEQLESVKIAVGDGASTVGYYFSQLTGQLGNFGQQIDALTTKLTQIFHPSLIYESVMDTFTEMEESSYYYVREAGRYLKEIWLKLISYTKQDIFGQMDKLENKAQSLWQTLKNKAVNWGLYELADRAVLRRVRDYDVEGRIERAFGYVRDAVRQTSDWQRLAPRLTVNEPAQGRLELEVPLPMSVHSLQDLANRFHPQSIKNAQQNLKDSLKKMVNGYSHLNTTDYQGYSIWDQIHSNMPASSFIDNLLRPQKSVAYLVGDRHLVTFDGRLVDFAGTCEYLLARDFVGGRFTVAAAFASRPRRHRRSPAPSKLRHISLDIAHQNIQITPHGKLIVGGEEKDLPWQRLDEVDARPLVAVTRTPGAITLTTHDQLSIACYLQHRLCSLTLPQTYHARSNGLLGSNDNEPYNDLHSVSGAENSASEHADQWLISGSCQHPSTTELSSASSLKCQKLFKDNSSPYSSCFSRVRPDSFYLMCAAAETSERAVCDVSSSYIDACLSKAGISLQLHSNCVRCEGSPESESLTGAETVTIKADDPLADDADVVFVVEERECMSFAGASLKQVSRSLTQQKRATKFGVIGVNGEGVHWKPHFHTGDGQILMDESQLAEAIQELAFKPQVAAPVELRDQMEALEYVADRFPFRTATQKNVILFTCSKCLDTTVDYYTLKEKYLNMNIKLHVLTKEELDINSENMDSISGFDASQLFDDSGEMAAESRQYLRGPHDSCTVLAQQTNGTVFSISPKKQRVVALAASRIGAVSAEAGRECQHCQCQLSPSTLGSRTLCSPCSPPKPARIVGNSNPFVQIGNAFGSIKSAAKKVLSNTDTFFLV